MRDHMALRVDPVLRDKLEELREDLHTPWKDATISDVLRMVMLTGIAEVQRKRKAGTLRTGMGRPEQVLGKRPPSK